MLGTIICGVTAAPEARAAAQLAEALAARLCLRLVFVHVADVGEGTGRAVVSLGRLAGGSLASDADLRVVHGSRVDALARVAADEGADLIVLGARARGPGRRQLSCTLARQLEAAQCVPVLIAPPATRSRSRRRLGLAETAADR